MNTYIRKYKNSIACKGELNLTQTDSETLTKEINAKIDEIALARSILIEKIKDGTILSNSDRKTMVEIESTFLSLISIISALITGKQINTDAMKAFITTATRSKEPNLSIINKRTENEIRNSSDRIINEIKKEAHRIEKLLPEAILEEIGSNTRKTIEQLASGMVYKYQTAYGYVYSRFLVIIQNGYYLRECKHCKRLMVTKDPRKRYCSETCKNAEKAARMEMRRNGIYKECEQITNLLRNRISIIEQKIALQSDTKKKRIAELKAEAEQERFLQEDFEKKKDNWLTKYKNGQITESDCLAMLKQYHESIKKAPRV